MQFIDWTELTKKYGKPAGSGIESVYWKMDAHMGIKVIRTPFRLPCGEGYALHINSDALFQSSKWREAERQFELMKILAKKKRCPAPVEIAVIRDDRADATGVGTFYYPAIIMEHVNFEELSLHESANQRYAKAFFKFLRLIGHKYDVQDTHTQNVVFSKDKKRFMIIDIGGVKPK